MIGLFSEFFAFFDWEIWESNIRMEFKFEDCWMKINRVHDLIYKMKVAIIWIFKTVQFNKTFPFLLMAPNAQNVWKFRWGSFSLS